MRLPIISVASQRLLPNEWRGSFFHHKRKWYGSALTFELLGRRIFVDLIDRRTVFRY